MNKKHSYNFKNLKGKRFGRLVVVSLNSIDDGKAIWNCMCDCGKNIAVSRNSLISGNTKSCGCLHNEIIQKGTNYKHGLTNTRIYKIWSGMKKRCNNPKDSNYKNYGAKNICVCNQWENDFMNFYIWSIMNGYKDNLTIDRINNEGNYEPNNCRWVTQKEQTRNVRTNVKITIKGKTRLLTDWAKISGIDRRTISKRIQLGWKEDELLNPIDITHKKKKKIS